MNEETVLFVCARCGFRAGLGAWFFGCPDCRRRGQVSVLEAAYPRSARPQAAPFGPTRDGFWGYASRLPVPDAASRLTLGEGNTPLVHSRRLGPSLGLPGLSFKCEGANPTLSFKDRYAAVATMPQPSGQSNMHVVRICSSMLGGDPLTYNLQRQHAHLLENSCKVEIAGISDMDPFPSPSDAAE